PPQVETLRPQCGSPLRGRVGVHPVTSVIELDAVDRAGGVQRHDTLVDVVQHRLGVALERIAVPTPATSSEDEHVTVTAGLALAVGMTEDVGAVDDTVVH